VKPCHLVYCLAVLVAAVHPAFAQNAPEVAIGPVRRAFHNGEHNAFTDLCRFKDQLYLTFRSCPDGHMVNPTATIIILRSGDEGATWQQVHRFAVKERDTRDPHFLVFKDRLFVYTGTWYSGTTTLPRDQYDMNKHLGYGVWSDDGASWSEPIILEGTFGHYIWRAATHGDKAYLIGRRRAEFGMGTMGEGGKIQSVLFESTDGLIWKTAGFFQPEHGNETAFLFEKDGSLLAVDRAGSGKVGQVLRSKPPYQEWERKDLDRVIGGPLLDKWGGHYLVGGRKAGPKTSLAWLVDDQLKEFAELPSGGDNSYPGFVELKDGRGLFSYYSSHEKDEAGKTMTAIYLVEISLKR